MRMGFEEQAKLSQMSLPQVKAHFRQGLQDHGTDVNLNDSQPQGDGDQSRVTAENAQFYRDMFATGADINHYSDIGMLPFCEFAKQCLSGDVKAVRAALERAKNTNQPTPDSLTRLMESRETSLRLTPLLMMVSIGKNMAMRGVSEKQMSVVKLLLEYGARPDARDVCGKTVCHYGAGAMATPMTLEAVRLCIKAHESGHFFGKQVELHSLNSAARNGDQGWCLGYQSDTGRRAVYLAETRETLAVKPENLKLVDALEQQNPTKLCDIPDRMGIVCLQEIIICNREDCARFLLEENHADLDVEDCDGTSPRSMCVQTPLGGFSMAALQGRKRDKNFEFSCSKCGVLKSDTASDVVQSASVSLLSKNGRGNIPSHREGSGYRKPVNVRVNEKFDIKVQAISHRVPLAIYDKSRHCNFEVAPGSPGFDELLQAAQAEPTWQGRKTFVTASFDAEGNCSVILVNKC
ncbi:expressed unknown protein [Seminavis robusta]|uniref:Uncharacterized protein n=1 Tax=Seminavis robusta TaxID=568900 RepID=A0A9N8E152_9STRA|nr:expressed unknown protein [Seminavis robusta]